MEGTYLDDIIHDQQDAKVTWKHSIFWESIRRLAKK